MSSNLSKVGTQRRHRSSHPPTMFTRSCTRMLCTTARCSCGMNPGNRARLFCKGEMPMLFISIIQVLIFGVLILVAVLLKDIAFMISTMLPDEKKNQPKRWWSLQRRQKKAASIISTVRSAAMIGGLSNHT